MFKRKPDPEKSEPAAQEEEEEERRPDKDSDEKETQASMQDFKRLFVYCKPIDVCFLAVGTIASIGAGVALPMMNIVIGSLAGNFNSYFTPGSTTTQDDFNSSLSTNALYFVYLFIARFVLSYISMFTYRLTGLRISAALRLAYLQAVFAQPIAVLDMQPPGFAATTITTSSNTVQLGISDKLALLIQSVSLTVAAIVIAFIYSWKLTLVAMSIILFIMIVYSLVVPVFVKRTREVENAVEKTSAIASESFSAIRMIAACCAEGRMIKRFNVWVDEAERRGMRTAIWSSLQLAPTFFAVYANFALVFWFGVRLYNWGDIDSVQTVIVSLFSVMMVVFSLGQVAGPIIAASKATAAAASFFKMIDRPRLTITGLKDPDVSAHKDIIFNDVVFAYPSRPHTKILDTLNLRVEAGKITAIVGPSGSGKSTIVGLLERWYEIKEGAEIIEGMDGETEKTEPSTDTTADDGPKEIVPISGTITIDGHELHTLDLYWWRSQIGLVQQEPFLFNDTIFANVAYGLIGSQWENESEEVKRDMVKEACKEAFADEFIDTLPDGYDTKVGDSGIKLSGGQRQRLAIARSVIKRPTILILDEATSAIDVRAERIVQQALDRVSLNRTTITIAHRLSTIKKADKIVVLRQGVVVEQGTHDTLLAHEDGVYSGLVRAQQLVMQGSDESVPEKEAVSVMIEEEHHDLAKQLSKADDEEKQKPTKRSLASSFVTLFYEQRSRWMLYLFALIGVCLAATSNPLQAYLGAQVITVFEKTGSDLISSSEFWSLMFFILALAVGVGYAIMGFTTTRLSVHICRQYREESFRRIVSKPIAFFDAEENSAGTLTSRVSNDPTQLEQLLGANLGMAAVAVIGLVGSMVLSLAFGWKLGLVGLFVSSPLILIGVFYRIRFEVSFEALNAAVFAESSQFAAEALGATRTVTSLTLEPMICQRYETLLQAHVTAATKAARWRLILVAASESISMLCMALTFWYGGTLLSTYEYNATQFFVIYTAVVQGSEQAAIFGSFGPNLAQVSAAADRILSLRDDYRDPTISSRRSSHEKRDLVTLPDDGAGGARLVLEDVHFRYPTRETPVFAGLNLTIEKGQFAALVGASGCGKTSVVSLLERFYDVQRGRITFNGVDIRDIEMTSYRGVLSLVAQEPNLFQGTIKENILLAVADDIDEELMHQACRDAEIHDFIMSLPEGYNTQLGSKGLSLSGGQKQRLSIARALIRNPQVLLLDEATSSLDSASEALVQAAFERASKGRTMVVVAHRLATVQNADVIFVLGRSDDGRGGVVLEQGSHQQLLRQKGMYWSMCQSQALDR